MAPLLAVALASSALAALQLRLDAGLRLEERAFTETTAAPASTAVAHSEVTPSLALEAHDRRSGLWLRYAPSLSGAEPTALGDPLVMHQASGAYERRLARRHLLRIDVGGMMGDLTYALAARTAPETGDLIATYPRGLTFAYANADASALLHSEVSERQTSQLSLAAGYTGPPPDEPSGLLMRQRRTSATARTDYELTPLDEVGAEATLGYTSFLEGPAYVSLAPVLRYRRELSEHTELRLRAGGQATVGKTLGQDFDRVPIFVPIGSAALRREAPRRAGGTLTAELEAAVTPFHDPFVGELFPRGSLSARLAVEEESGYRLFALARAYRILDADVPGVYPEVLGVVAAGTAIPLVSTVLLEVGGVLTARQDRAGVGDDRLGEPDLLAYVALSAAVGLIR